VSLGFMIFRASPRTSGVPVAVVPGSPTLIAPPPPALPCGRPWPCGLSDRCPSRAAAPPVAAGPSVHRGPGRGQRFGQPTLRLAVGHQRSEPLQRADREGGAAVELGGVG